MVILPYFEDFSLYWEGGPFGRALETKLNFILQ